MHGPGEVQAVDLGLWWRPRPVKSALVGAVVALAVVVVAVILGHTALPGAGSGVRVTAGTAPAIAGTRPTTAGVQRLPLPAQALISRTVGSQSAVFAPHSLAGGAYGFSGGGVTARFSAGSARLSARGGAITLALTGVGRGGVLRHVPQRRPVVDGHRVVYRTGVVSTWYLAGPLGLEQGFDVTRRPAGHGPLTLALGTGGSLSALRGAGSGSMAFTDTAGRAVLRYGGLAVIDARGRPVRATLAVGGGGRLLIRVADRGARYPLRIDPFIQQQAKLVGNCSGCGENGNGQFGIAVGLSADGNTALVGGWFDHGFSNTTDSGAAWVFTRSGGTWSQQGPKLVGDCTGPSCGGPLASGESGEGEFGSSVSLSADGNTAVIGAPQDHGNEGAVWVFTRSNGGWSGGTVLVGDCTSTCSGPAGTGEMGTGEFGSSVSLAASGNTLLIGAFGDNSSTGAAWVFTRAAGTWSQQHKITASGASASGLLGSSVALSADGTKALVGAPFENGGDGGAWEFSGPSWSQAGAEIVADCGSGCSGTRGTGEAGSGEFGVSVALSQDGTTALIGAPDDSLGAGATWAFTGTPGSQVQEGGKLVVDCTSSCGGANGTGESGGGDFGWSVALSANGGTALIGGLSDDGSDGSAWLFGQAGGAWSQQADKLRGDCTGAGCTGPSGTGEVGAGQFGSAVALAADGATALVGAPVHSGSAGAAWAFVSPPTCVSGSAATASGGGAAPVALSCSAPTGTSPTYSIVAGPAHGAVSAFNSSTGTFTYTSTPGFFGADSLTYQATDSGGASAVATVSITVPPAAPACGNTSATTPRGGGTVTVTLACTAPAGAAVSYAILSGPAHGTLGAVSPTGTVTYTSQAGVAGAFSFTYQASDSGGTSAPATATVSVPASPPNLSIVGDATPVVGVASGYSASIIDRDGTPNSFVWKVDGRKAGTKQSLRFTFTSGGKHTVTVTVGDTAGSHATASLVARPGFRQLNPDTSWGAVAGARSTRFTSLVGLALPISTRVVIACTGPGCPAGHRTLTVSPATTCHTKKCTKKNKKKKPANTRDIDMLGSLAGHHLGVGATVTITYTLRFWVGQVVTFRVDSHGAHKRSVCLAPGSSKPGKDCTS
jgi:hypothetical protein